MSKPPGVTWDMRLRRSTPVEDAIWDAVEKAIDDGWTVEQFRIEAAASWREKQRQDMDGDRKAWAE